MLSIARRTAAGAAVLLVIPGRLVLRLDVAARTKRDVAESPILDNRDGHPAVGIITHVLLCGWFLWCLRFRLRAALVLLPFSAGPYSSGRGEVVGERSRAGTPSFRRLAGKTHHVPVDEFYNLKRKDRGALVKEQLAEQQDIPTFYANTGKRDRLCVSFRAYDVCCQLGATWRRTAVAASAYPHDCDFAGLGDRRNGQPDAAGDALAA